MKAVVAAFNQEKAFSMITNLRVNLQALAGADHSAPEQCNTHHSIHTPHTTGHCSPLYTINISLSILEPNSNHGQRCLADYSMFYRTALEVISIVFIGLLGELWPVASDQFVWGTMSVVNVTNNGWLVVWWKTISTFYMPKHSCQEYKIDVSHVWSQCMLFIDYWPIHCILTTRQIRKLIQNIHRAEVATIRISRVRHRPVARGH